MTKCGTDHGWHAHRSRGETPCFGCTVAHDQAMAAWQAAREAVAPPTPRRGGAR